MGDLRPAPMIRDTDLDAPTADSRLMLAVSESFLKPTGDELREPARLSLDPERDLDKVPLKACFKDPPRRAEVVALIIEVSFVCVSVCWLLLLEVVIVDAVDEGICLSSSDSLAKSTCERERGDDGEAVDAVDLDLKALKISRGKSATPIVKLAIVPNSAEAPPEMGSQGPSSVSYSRERYLSCELERSDPMHVV